MTTVKLVETSQILHLLTRLFPERAEVKCRAPALRNKEIYYYYYYTTTTATNATTDTTTATTNTTTDNNNTKKKNKKEAVRISEIPN
jgi:hypothetical protein